MTFSGDPNYIIAKFIRFSNICRCFWGFLDDAGIFQRVFAGFEPGCDEWQFNRAVFFWALAVMLAGSFTKNPSDSKTSKSKNRDFSLSLKVTFENFSYISLNNKTAPGGHVHDQKTAKSTKYSFLIPYFHKISILARMFHEKTQPIPFNPIKPV